MVTLEVRLLGYQFSQDDIDTIKREFGEIAPLRATGGWVPAAGPAAGIDIFLTFFGETLAAILVQKGLELTWSRIAHAWQRYREQRVAAGKREPELDHLVLRADDTEVHINLLIDPQSPDLLRLMALLGERLTTGALRNLPIRRIELPSRPLADGTWERVPRYEYDGTCDEFVWWVEGKYADSRFGFYDARADRWLSS